MNWQKQDRKVKYCLKTQTLLQEHVVSYIVTFHRNKLDPSLGQTEAAGSSETLVLADGLDGVNTEYSIT
jgi:hypothetical protein